MAGHADDFELLGRFARARDEPAFAEVVRRHLNLVYSSAVRRVGDRHLAEDVTQAVFVILAKKAKSVRSSRAPLGAWLLTTVRYAAANALKIEARRRKHEGRAAAAASAAAYANPGGACSANPSDVIVWQEVASQLDDAVLKLPAVDRRAILMRYFEDRPIAEIAEALRVTEGAAKMRLSRSVEKLRKRLERSGAGAAAALPVGAAGFDTMLATHAVRAAPAGLMQHAIAASLGGAAAGAAGAAAGTGAAIAIAKGAIAMMSWKSKIAAAVVAAAMLGTGTVLTMSFAGAQAPKAQDAPSAGKAEAPAATDESNAENTDDKASLATAPPVVVKTVPQSGMTGVDPKTAEIRVTYSKSMTNGSWSWSTWGEENFPKLNGKPRYEADRRTCVLPVKLEPNKFYAIWLNSQNFGNFKDSGGRPAVPYLLVFRTK